MKNVKEILAAGYKRATSDNHLTLNLMFFGMSGEVCSEYAFYIRQSYAGGFIVTAAYTNGTEGYIPTSKMLIEGGYEPDESYVYFSFPSRYDSSIEKILIKEIKDILIL